MVYHLVAWGFVVLGLSYAVVCVLNLLGFAPGRLRNDKSEPMPTLACALMGVGLAGFFWSPGPPDASPATWQFYWLGVGAAGLVLLAVGGAWHWFRRGARKDGALFFLRVYTNRADWKPKHAIVIAAFVVSVSVLDRVSEDGWLSWVALIAFMVLLNSLRILPIHTGRRPPTSLDRGVPT